MSDCTPITARGAAEILMAIEHPTVVIHVRPDGDAAGSGAALVLILRALGKDADMISADPIPSRLSFLTEGIDIREDTEGRELVSIDVASPAQLGRFADLDFKLMIDHHAKGTPFADHFIIPDASSAAEVLYEIFFEINALSGIRMTPDIAMRLYAAMSSDTGGFIYSNASPATYRRAAALIECGIDQADVNHRLFNSKSKAQINAEGYVASHIETACDGRVAYAVLPYADRVAMGLGNESFETAIDVVRAMEGAEVAFFLRETEPGRFRASLRSVGADVATVAAAFGGGGHIRAAGCSPTADSIDTARDMLLSKIKDSL